MYKVEIFDGKQYITRLCIGETKKEVEKRIWRENEEDISFHRELLSVEATEIKEIEGYKVELRCLY